MSRSRNTSLTNRPAKLLAKLPGKLLATLCAPVCLGRHYFYHRSWNTRRQLFQREGERGRYLTRARNSRFNERSLIMRPKSALVPGRELCGSDDESVRFVNYLYIEVAARAFLPLKLNCQKHSSIHAPPNDEQF